MNRPRGGMVNRKNVPPANNCLKDGVVFKPENLSSSALSAMDAYRREGRFCDVTLKVDGQSCTAHRVVLAASIPYFEAMFTCDMVEAKLKVIEIPGIHSSALEALVNFAYCGEVQINANNDEDLLVASDFLRMQTVKDACGDFIKQRLNVQNVLGIKAFAEQLSCPSLIEAAKKFILERFSEVSKTEGFLNLTKAEVVEIIARDELVVASEEQVFEAVMSWTKKTSSCEEHLVELLAKVRLPLLKPKFLSERVASEELIKNSLECRDLLDEARDYHLIPERRKQPQTSRTKPRCGSRSQSVNSHVNTSFTKTGYSRAHCPNCGYPDGESFYRTLGHSLAPWPNPGFFDAGNSQVQCQNCGYSLPCL